MIISYSDLEYRHLLQNVREIVTQKHKGGTTVLILRTEESNLTISMTKGESKRLVQNLIDILLHPETNIESKELLWSVTNNENSE